MQKIEAIRSSRLFSGLPEKALAYLADAFEEKNYEAGGTVFVTGDQGSSMYIVGSGMVKVAVAGPDGIEKVMAGLVPGEHFGALSLLHGGHRMATARAETGTVLFELGREGLHRLRDEKAELALRLLLLIARDFAGMVRENEAFLEEALAARAGRG